MVKPKKQTHFRVYNDLNDSKYGWSSRGVAESAVAIKSSRTSFGGVGSAILWVSVILFNYVCGERSRRVDTRQEIK